jgi:hypothetical protein
MPNYEGEAYQGRGLVRCLAEKVDSRSGHWSKRKRCASRSTTWDLIPNQILHPEQGTADKGKGFRFRQFRRQGDRRHSRKTQAQGTG